MKRLLILVSLLYSMQASGWVFDADFENGVIGEKATGEDGFSGAFSVTLYTNERSHSGKQSAKATIREGTDGWREWGGSWKYPSKLGEGDEIWYRVWMYLPDGYDLSCGGCSEGAKFMRTHTASSAGEHEGYHNYQAMVGGMLMSTSVNNYEFYKVSHPSPGEDRKDIGDKITTGTWHAYEHYIKFSGTKGVIRAWQDGRLIFEDMTTPTLRSSTSHADFSYLFTYWRKEGPTQTQSAFIDDVIITNERPSNTDSHGNPFVGVGDATFTPIEGTSAPNPPSLIK